MTEAKPKRMTQKFYLEGDVEVTIKFPPGAARWQSTQQAVSIATGEGDALPQIGRPHETAGVLLPTTNGPTHDTPEMAALKEGLQKRKKPLSSRDLMGAEGAAELEFGLLS